MNAITVVLRESEAKNIKKTLSSSNDNIICRFFKIKAIQIKYDNIS